MKASEIVTNLIQKGVYLWIDNEQLKIRSPKGVITPEIQENLMAYKTEILDFIRERDITVNIEPTMQGLNLQTI